MKIAIVLGVSTYANLPALAACQRDATHMAGVLRATGNYEEMLVVDGADAVSGPAKDRLVGFLQARKGQTIEEVLFYYSGHGDFDGTDFYYLWSDYDPKRRRQTSLQNREVDSLLKMLQPTLAVKVVDACHSGLSYIKDPSAVESYLKSSQDTFGKCYFLFSSMADQVSYADSEASDFTKSLLASLDKPLGAAVRYKDIIDHVSDDFESRKLQTPLFVTQADFTELFCSINSDVIKEIQGIKVQSSTRQATLDAAGPKGLLDYVQDDASRYCSQDEVMQKVLELETLFQRFQPSVDLAACYEVNVAQVADYDKIPAKESIAAWVKEAERSWFAKVGYRTEIREERVPKSLMAGIAALADVDDDEHYKTVRKRYSVPARVEASLEMPYAMLDGYAAPKYPNLTPFSILLVPLVSKTDMAIFYGLMEYAEVSWGNFEQVKASFKWRVEILPLKTSDFDRRLSAILLGCWADVDKSAKERFVAKTIPTPPVERK